MKPAMATGTPTMVEVSRDRYGYRIKGQFLRRVTTLCNGIPKDALPGWAAKTVAEFAYEHREQWQELPRTDAIKLLKGVPWSQRDDAGDRGTAVHAALEAIVHDRPIPDDVLTTEDELACAAAAEEFLRSGSWKPLGSEITVFSEKHGYAGTFDLLADEPGGTRWILDYKTGSGVYPNMAVQQSAYHNAEYAVVRKKPLGKPGEERWQGELIPWGPDRAGRLGIVHIQPDGARLYPIKPEWHNRLWTTFRAAAHVKMFLLDTDSGFGRRPREPVYEEPVETIGERKEGAA